MNDPVAEPGRFVEIGYAGVVAVCASRDRSGSQPVGSVKRESDDMKYHKNNVLEPALIGTWPFVVWQHRQQSRSYDQHVRHQRRNPGRRRHSVKILNR